MRVIVTGSRYWRDRDLVFAVLDDLLRPFEDNCGDRLVVRHGDNYRGADAHAHQWCRRMIQAGRPVVEDPMPADWDLLGPAAGMIRNKKMVDAGAELVIAFPLPDGKGTQGCMRYAATKGIPVRNYGRLK